MPDSAPEIRPAIQEAFDMQAAGVFARRQSFGLAERKRALTDLSEMINGNEQDIIEALRQDFGKSETETVLTEIIPVIQEIKHTRAHLRKWMRPKRVMPGRATVGTTARVRYEARGVCLIIAPWNYPFSLALGPLVSCLAAGNSAVIKPSEMTPATSALLARLIAETFPADLVTVIVGAVETSQELLALPFDHMFFTGSPAVGKIVMEAASKVLASVTLELGGKSPTIIGPQANLKQAADWIVFGKFSNAGQTCIAPDHLYVHRSVKEEFTMILRARMTKAYGQSGRSADLARIVDDKHAKRLGALLQDAVSKGARVTHGGTRDGTVFEPTLLEAIMPEMEIDQQEIFGPILPIMPYDDLNKVIAQINARPKPLSLYIFDRDRGRVEKIITGTSSGSVGVNLTLVQFIHAGLPFGGVNNSGIGNAHGHYGFLAFSHERAVLKNRFLAMPLIFPPYNDRVKRLTGVIKRMIG